MKKAFEYYKKSTDLGDAYGTRRKKSVDMGDVDGTERFGCCSEEGIGAKGTGESIRIR